MNDVDHNHKYDVIDTFAARCYGPTGDDLGDVPVGICPVTIRETEEEAWGVFEIPDECTNLIAVCDTRDEAVAVAEQYVAENDED